MSFPFFVQMSLRCRNERGGGEGKKGKKGEFEVGPHLLFFSRGRRLTTTYVLPAAIPALSLNKLLMPRGDFGARDSRVITYYGGCLSRCCS